MKRAGESQTGLGQIGQTTMVVTKGMLMTVWMTMIDRTKEENLQKW